MSVGLYLEAGVLNKVVHSLCHVSTVSGIMVRVAMATIISLYPSEKTVEHKWRDLRQQRTTHIKKSDWLLCQN